MADIWYQTKKFLRLKPETPVLMRDLWAVIKEITANTPYDSESFLGTIEWDDVTGAPFIKSEDSSKDFVYTGDDLTTLTCYTDNTKTVVKYTKEFTYTGGGDLLTSTVTYNGTTTVYTYVYDIDGNLTNINQT